MAWSNRISEVEKRPAQILIDDQFRSSAPIHEVPRLAWIAVYCRQPPQTGFWEPEEGAPLDAIEDHLIQLCDERGHGWAVYVLRIATRGIREYFVYFGAGADLEKVVPALKIAHPDYRIEFEAIDDPTWKRYLSFLPPQ